MDKFVLKIMICKPGKDVAGWNETILQATTYIKIFYYHKQTTKRLNFTGSKLKKFQLRYKYQLFFFTHRTPT